MSFVRTIEQERSKFAYECVKKIKDKKFSGDYKSLVKKFPMMLLKNGLLQTVAFLEAKAKDHHKALLGQLKEYLTDISPLNLKIDMDVSEYLSSIDVGIYRNITSDILTFSKWLGRYAEALIEKEGASE